MLEKHGSPLRMSSFETLNIDGYACPYCRASCRDRLYALYIEEFISGIEQPRCIRMLDFAPAPGTTRRIRELARNHAISLAYRSADLYSEAVDDQVDIMDMKIYEDDSFDFILCSHILEHVEDDRRALRELRRVLKKSGTCILMTPIYLGINHIDEDPSEDDEAERCRRFGQDDHIRLYSKSGFLERVRESGLSVRELGLDHFGKDTFFTYGITEQSVLYIVEK